MGPIDDDSERVINAMMTNMLANYEDQDLVYSLILARFFIGSLIRRVFTPDDYADLKEECPGAFKQAEEALNCVMIYEKLLWRVKTEG